MTSFTRALIAPALILVAHRSEEIVQSVMKSCRTSTRHEYDKWRSGGAA
jgi:hypothetical protein